MNWHKPPAIAKQLQIDAEKVRELIRLGLLVAVDVASPGSRRPRFRISEEALNDFLLQRQVRLPVKPVRRKRQNENVKQYF